MSDILHRVIAESGKVFGLACDTTRLVNEACRRHDVGPTAAAALGRALTGSVLLAALLKGNQHVQLKFEGSGPLGKIIAEAGCEGWARGYVANPLADVPLKDGRVDVAGGLGRAGFLTVTKDIGLKQKYQGMVQLYTSEIGEDIAYYLLESEQTPSVVALSIQLNQDGSVGAAGGFLIQALPPVDNDAVSSLEKRIGAIPSISAHLLAGGAVPDILSQLFADIPHHATASTRLHFNCSCSREKMANAVLSLGKDEVIDLLEKEGGAEVQCQFCRGMYRFGEDELRTMIHTLERAH